LGGNIRWGRPFGLEAELEMADDLIYGFRIFDKRDDSHLASTGRTKQRIHFVDLADHLGPAFGGPKRLLLLDDHRVRRRGHVLSYLPPVGIRVKAVITHHDLTFVRDVRGDSGDKLQIIKPLFLGALPRILIANLPLSLIEEEPLQTQQRADHVFTDSFCLSFFLRPDLAMNIETCVAPAEDLLDKGKADELSPEKQREDLVGEYFLDNLVMETTDTMESTIRGCAPFSNHPLSNTRISALPEVEEFMVKLSGLIKV